MYLRDRLRNGYLAGSRGRSLLERLQVHHGVEKDDLKYVLGVRFLQRLFKAIGRKAPIGFEILESFHSQLGMQSPAPKSVDYRPFAPRLQ
jgi:hypothetical protein